MCCSHLKQRHWPGFIHVSAESTFVLNQPFQVGDQIRIVWLSAIFWWCRFFLQSTEYIGPQDNLKSQVRPTQKYVSCVSPPLA